MIKTILGLLAIIFFVTVYLNSNNSLVDTNKSPENMMLTQKKNIISSNKNNTKIPKELTAKVLDKSNHKADDKHDHDKCIAETLGEAPMDEESQISIDMERIESYPSNSEDKFRDAKEVYENNGLELIEYNSDTR